MKPSYRIVTTPVKETETYGGALLSTIEQTSVLGKVGREVLARQGIDEIVVSKKYPSLIRQEIHKVIGERFGNHPLFYFGILQIEGFKGEYLPIKEGLDKFYTDNQAKLHSTNFEERLIWLEKFISKVGETSQRLLQKATGDVFFELNYSRIDDLSWEVRYRHPSVITYEEPYSRGSMLHWFVRYLSLSWDFNMDINPEKSIQGAGWSTYVWTLRFIRRDDEVDLKRVDPFFEAFKQKARDKLFQCVIEDAANQKEKVEELLGQLGKYTPPQIQKALEKGEYDTRIATRRKKLTIFFSDISNFTSTSEGLQPEDLTKYLNEYFSEMTSIALRFGATIDKYIGDAMMVFFGDPDSNGERQDARNCVEMALCMQDKMKELQEKWRNEGFADPFKVRMGMNTGYCNVGNFGSEQRLTYTIIGGEVNVAQRLESAANPNGILMSYETFAHAQDMIDAEEREAIKMKGINREIKILSVICRKVLSAEEYNRPTSDSIEVKPNGVSGDNGGKTMQKRMQFLEGKVDNLDKKMESYFTDLMREIKGRT